MNIKHSGTVGAFVALAVAGLAHAQTVPATAGGSAPEAESTDQLAEVVVTAEKRENSVQNIADTISVVSGEDMAQQGVKTLDDALKDVAGVKIAQSNAPTGFDPTIRGVGPSVPTTFGADTGVATNYDGVYTGSALSTMAGYYDMARIEILKGPQGTLYGRNAEGGVLNIVSNDPTQKLESAASAEVGSYDLLHFTGMLNVPVSDTLAIRVAGSSIDRHGYLSNGTDDDVASSVRAKVLFKPSDAFSLLAGAEYDKVGGEGSGVVNGFVSQPSGNQALYSPYPDDQIFQQQAYKLWAQAKVDLGFGQLTVLPAYQWQQAPQQATYNSLGNTYSLGQPGGLKQRSAEARLTSENGARVQWVGGAYYYDSDQSSSAYSSQLLNGVTAPLGNLTYRDFAGKTKGLFAQATIPLVGGLRLIAGGRESWDDKTAKTNQTGTLVTNGGDWTNFDYKAGLEYDLAPHSMLYATYATGYRPGGISPAPPNPIYLDEHLKSTEIGTKNEFLDRTLRLNADVYYYDYSNLQEPNLVPLIVGGVFSGFTLSIPNVPKVENYGGEIESEYLITPHDHLAASVAYLHSEVKSNITIFFTQMQGMPLPNTPPWTANLNYKHIFALAHGGTITPRVDLNYSSSYYVTIPPNPGSTQWAYWQEDASVTYGSAKGNWSLNFYGKNLSNVILKSNDTAGSLVVGPPRTFGVDISAHF